MALKCIALVCGLMLSACASFASDNCKPNVVDLRSGEVQVRFRVEVADTAREHARGLMDREKMARSRGMLFVYDKPHRASFWMKNTIIPLDILFMDETGTVKRIAENTVPFSLKPIDGGDDIVLVLEINAGLSKTFRLSEGAQMRHPDVDQSLAAWKCDEVE